jgi:hypothetical protein
LTRHGSSAQVRQGETGAPSQYQENFALSKLQWSETTQAKWNLRRMLAHHGQNIPFNLFTICDMHYRDGQQVRMNYKGLLGTRADQSISHIKPSYFAAQTVFAVFDESLQVVTNVSCRPLPSADITNQIASYAFLHKPSGSYLFAIWFRGSQPVETNQTTPVDFRVEGTWLTRAVYVDLRTGRSYELPRQTAPVLKAMPLYDSPVVLADRQALPRISTTIQQND